MPSCKSSSSEPREVSMIHLTKFTQRCLHTDLKSSFDYQRPMTPHCCLPSGTPSLAVPAVLHVLSYGNTCLTSRFSG